MRHFKLTYFWGIALILVLGSKLHAQTINPYLRMIDPLAIARLDEPDFYPIRVSYGYLGSWWGEDSTNPGYTIFAQDTGAGIITHLFVTSRVPDSLTTFKLYVDGYLLRMATMQNFYDSTDGYLSNPFDTIIGEARLCDVQIPYHHGFKLLSKDPITWYDYAWRPLPASLNIPPTGGLRTESLLQEEEQADSVYYNPRSIWKGMPGTDSSFGGELNPGQGSTLFTVNGSNIVKRFWLLPSYYDSTLDSVWLDIYWDGEAIPSISTSLLSLFGQSYDFRDLHSLPIDFTQDSGFELRLPMPFAHSMRIAFRNNSSKPITMLGRVSLMPQSVDPDSFGYLHARYSQTDPTKFGVPHHVLHIKGKGKYVGLLMGIHDLHIIGTYEGDAMFDIDSADYSSFHYEGLEDYFNGAAYFSYGNFFMPFGGTSNNIANYFRFHYLDEVNFHKSLEFNFQHGIDNDAHEYYRTLALWYQRQIPFWMPHDTIRAGESWDVAGAGYPPNESIHVLLDSVSIGQLTANADGTFDLRTIVPNLPLGFHILSVNGLADPYSIYVTCVPTIQLLDEPKPLAVKVGDTLHFGGAGFEAGDSIIATVGGAFARSRSSITSDNQISGWLVVPELVDSTYFVMLEGANSGRTASPEPVQVTRTLRFECENLWTPATSSFGTSQFLPLLNYLPNDFSQTAALWFRPDSVSIQTTESFFVPYSDTFSVYCRFGRGTLFGNYDILLDDSVIGKIMGYDTVLYRSDSLWLGARMLDTGEHSLIFRYTGREYPNHRLRAMGGFYSTQPDNDFCQLGSNLTVRSC